MQIKGVIFDMDGLILDTEKLYQRFWKEASAQCGFDMPQEIALKLRSLDKTLAKTLLHEFFGSSYSYEEVKALRIKMMNSYVEQNGISAKPGVRELAAYLNKHGYETAIATATNYQRADEHLTLAGVRDCFDNIICACDLQHGKPYPDVYLYACKMLGLKPCECAALEDSPNGVRSAHSAGCIPILIPDGGNTEDEVSDIIFARVNSLSEVIGILDNNHTD